MVREMIQVHRSWALEDDQALIELAKAGKSWVFIAARLKRSVKQVQDRHRLLRRQSEEASEPKATSDQSPFLRFIIRNGTREGDFMVWDREARGPAKLPTGRLAIGLSRDQAKIMKQQLTEASQPAGG